MMNHTPLCISLVAPSGAGKSTTASLMKAAFERMGRTVEVLKLAAPLYSLQSCLYQECGVSLRSGQQDQRLLEVIATEMRRVASDSLVRNFEARLMAVRSDVVINDDLRDDKTDWPWLKRKGFTVVRVLAGNAIRNDRLQQRGDLTVVLDSSLDAQIDNILEDYRLLNDSTIDVLRARVEDLTSTLLMQLANDVTPRH